MIFDKNEKTTDMVRARSDEGSKNPNQEDTPMTKTEKAETAAVDAPGIETTTTEPEIIEPFFWRDTTVEDEPTLVSPF